MNYLPLDEFKYAFAFRHKELELDEATLAQIKFMTPARSQTLWRTFISKDKDHPDFFDGQDWPGNGKTWLNTVKWETAWEHDEALPFEIETHLEWEDNTTVYYCLSHHHIIETSWALFKKHWLNFLFMSDGALLIGKKRNQVVQFLENGYAKLGRRPE